MRVFDIDSGIGTHVTAERGLIHPGVTMVSTDSHANIVGAFGAFGQGLGDVDMAHVFAFGRTWFRLPPTIKIVLRGRPGPQARPKDVVLAVLGKMGAAGLLGHAAEYHGDFVQRVNVVEHLSGVSAVLEQHFRCGERRLCQHIFGDGRIGFGKAHCECF